MTASGSQAEPVARAIVRDRDAGLTPFAIAAVVGSTNTGSVDAVGDLADVAAAEDLWLHVDAAYGGAARLSARDRERVSSLDRADSVTVDPHKWFFQSYDIGGLLVRQASHLAETFGGRSPEYYRGGEASGGGDADRRRRTRRRRRADQLLQAQLRGHATLAGTEALDVVEASRHGGFRPSDRGQRRPRGASRVRCAEADDLEAVPEIPELSVVCFRHLPGGRAAALALPPGELDAHQDRLQAALEASGDGWLTTTRLRGATYLRAGIVNYLATEADIDRLLATLRRLADDDA